MFPVEINVGYGYEIHFTRDVFSRGNHVLKDIINSRDMKRRHEIIFFLEKKIAALYPGISDGIADYFRAEKNISLVSKPLVMPGGEDGKNFELTGKLCRMLADSHLCRQSFVCIVGGGRFLTPSVSPHQLSTAESGRSGFPRPYSPRMIRVSV